MKPIIRVENLSKKYRIGAKSANYLTFREMLGKTIRAPFNRKKRTADDEFWALENIEFEVQPGEVVGIIGRNGAGKSTLLKILSRITEPTKGRIELFGRVGSLLEVGTGFHPELTGRENIFLNGAILGMRHGEIAAKFDEIVDFAGIEKFLDTPVKHFSSGMYVRLAFAVAAHLEPEILVVDEVLAVGDAEFQKKCLGKMDEVSKTGRTVLFVSHQMGSIARLCQTSLLLENGKLIVKDATAKVISRYLSSHQNADDFYQAADRDKGKSVYFEYVKMVDNAGAAVNSIEHDQPLIVEFKLEFNEQVNDLSLGFSLQDATQKRLFTIHHLLKKTISGADQSVPIRLKIPGNLLTPGHYSWIIAAFVEGSEMIDAHWDVCKFDIIDAGTEFANYDGADYGCIFVHDYSFEPVV